MSVLPGIPPHLLEPLLSSILYSTRESVEPSVELPWTLVQLANKGMAAIASSNLPLGTQLIAESPICIWNQSLTSSVAQELFNQLSEEQKKAYLSLCKTAEGGVEDEILSRRAANGFAIRLPTKETEEEGDGVVLAFVFEKISRLNHSW